MSDRNSTREDCTHTQLTIVGTGPFWYAERPKFVDSYRCILGSILEISASFPLVSGIYYFQKRDHKSHHQ